MQQEDSGAALSANIKALMQYERDKNRDLTSDAKVAKRAGVDQKTVWRMVNEANSARVESVAKVAEAFGLSTWQILVPGLDPSNPPVVAMTEVERSFYARLRHDLEILVTDPPKPSK